MVGLGQILENLLNHAEEKAVVALEGGGGSYCLNPSASGDGGLLRVLLFEPQEALGWDSLV